MSDGKEITFALLILAAPHMSETMAWWIAGGMVVAAILLSDAVKNAMNRIRWHITRQ